MNNMIDSCAGALDSTSGTHNPRRPSASAAAMDSFEIPVKPLITIQAAKSRGVDFAELWKYRDLLYVLTARDLKVRYKQALFGLAWVIIQPLMITAIFTVFLGMLARVPT